MSRAAGTEPTGGPAALAQPGGSASAGGGGGGGVWLHGVVGHLDPDAVAGITGMGGRPLRTVRNAGLAAVVSHAPLVEYGEDAMRRNLEDLGWLERAAREHHRVVDTLARAGPVVPARLATVYRDDRRVAQVLAEQRARFVAALDRVAGRAEWGVKGYAVPEVSGEAVAGRAVAGRAAPGTSTPAPAAGAGGAGAEYLRRRRAQLARQEEDELAAARDAAAVHTALEACAVAVRRHRPQDRRLSGADTAMVLNGAYLVDVTRLTEFTGLVEELSRRYPAVRLELTGPWPPYSFVGDEEPQR